MAGLRVLGDDEIANLIIDGTSERILISHTSFSNHFRKSLTTFQLFEMDGQVLQPQMSFLQFLAKRVLTTGLRIFFKKGRELTAK